MKSTPNGRFRGTTPELHASARDLRRRMTPAEIVLGSALRRKQLNGLTFRRQHPVGQFVLDFFCPARKLVVELDGAIHNSQIEQDQARTDHLVGCGYRVIRFRNDEVLSDPESVVARIRQALNEPSN